jgi:hypothetical protein
MANELDLLLEPGDPCRGECGSEFCLKRARLKMPPRLLLPVVDVEFRVLPTIGGGVSILARPQELVVDDRSLIPRRVGGCRGEDIEDE